MKYIAVIEDEPTHSLLLRYNLENMGINITTHSSQENFFENWQTQVFDLIILSMELDESDGLQICQTFRDKGIVTKILFLTTSLNIPGCACIDAWDYLKKPFSIQELRDKVNEMITTINN